MLFDIKNRKIDRYAHGRNIFIFENNKLYLRVLYQGSTNTDSGQIRPVFVAIVLFFQKCKMLILNNRKV